MNRTYRNPPIVEALCEFRFDPASPWDLTIPGLVWEEIKSTFPQKKSATGLELGIHVGAGSVRQQVEPTTRMQFLREDATALVQVGTNLLSVNHLRPYPGWQAFAPLIEQGYRAYLEVAQPKSIHRIALRYINRIELLGPRVEMEEYFDFYPFLGSRLPQDYADFIVGIQTAFNGLRDGLRLQLAGPPSKTGDPVLFVLDIDYFLAKPEAVGLDQAIHWVDEAHNRVEDIFEGSISDKLRELFQREKAE
jgi:uncharacterized protein (TIGR04255 family)